MRGFFLFILLIANIAFGDTFRLAPSCDPFAKKLRATSEHAVARGLQCLSKINSPIARLHAQKIQNLLRVQKPLIRCDLKTEGLYGFGSVPEQVDHPYIRLNTSNETSLSANTIFHELFHNIGMRHYEQGEYAFTCGECCFPTTSKTRSAACKLCGQSEVSTLQYKSHLNEFLIQIDRSYMAVQRMVDELAVSPDSRELWVLFGQALQYSYPEVYPAFTAFFADKFAVSPVLAISTSHNKASAYFRKLFSSFDEILQGSIQKVVLPTMEELEKLELSDGKKENIRSFISLLEKVRDQGLTSAPR